MYVCIGGVLNIFYEKFCCLNLETIVILSYFYITNKNVFFYKYNVSFLLNVISLYVFVCMYMYCIWGPRL